MPAACSPEKLYVNKDKFCQRSGSKSGAFRVWEQERWRTSLSLSEPHPLSNLWLFAETEIPGKAALQYTGISGYGSSKRPDLSLRHHQLSEIPFSLLSSFSALQLICHGTERTFTYVYSKANRVCSVTAVARL